MRTPKFELNKLVRLIRTHGVPYEFQRDGVDEFKEPVKAASKISVNGVYHEQSQPLTLTEADAASVRQKQSPYILALFSEANGIKQGDYVIINGLKYTVVGTNNIGNWNLALDISLEEPV